MIVAHFSDIHFGAEIPEIVDGLLTRLDEIRPDLVVASGDFTMAGRRREFAEARAFLERIPFPVLATPGNHDVPVYNLLQRFVTPFRRYERAIAPVSLDRYAGPDAAVLSLNSARPWDLSFNWSHGRLSRAQIERADTFFGHHADTAFKALVVHHPFVVPEDLPGFRVIGNSDRMLTTLARHRVDAILTGHLHRQFTTVRTLPMGVGSHEITLLQVATVASTRHRDQPNAFAVIRTHPEGFTCTTEVWTGSAFEPRPDRTRHPDAAPHEHAPRAPAGASTHIERNHR